MENQKAVATIKLAICFRKKKIFYTLALLETTFYNLQAHVQANAIWNSECHFIISALWKQNKQTAVNFKLS